MHQWPLQNQELLVTVKLPGSSEIWRDLKPLLKVTQYASRVKTGDWKINDTEVI